MKNRFAARCRLEIVGTMPERALLRLRRSGITLYEVQKPQPNALRLTIDEGDLEKVFALYPKRGDGEERYTAYTVRVLGRTGWGRYRDFAKRRAGFALGVCLFCGTHLLADDWVLGVEFSASTVYAREALAALEAYGVTPFSRYEEGNEDLICSRLLGLEGVEFCSVKKSGMRVVVEIRLGDLPRTLPTQGDMHARHEGVILSITALKGSLQKEVGERVSVGETLVGAWMETGEETRKATEVVARVSIACSYACTVAAADEQEAFALAYLQASLTGEERLTETTVTAEADGYRVTIEYIAIESMNF